MMSWSQAPQFGALSKIRSHSECQNDWLAIELPCLNSVRLRYFMIFSHLRSIFSHFPWPIGQPSQWDPWDPWDLAVAQGLRGPGRRPDLPTAAGSLAASLQGGMVGDGGGLGVGG